MDIWKVKKNYVCSFFLHGFSTLSLYLFAGRSRLFITKQVKWFTQRTTTNEGSKRLVMSSTGSAGRIWPLRSAFGPRSAVCWRLLYGIGNANESSNKSSYWAYCWRHRSQRGAVIGVSPTCESASSYYPSPPPRDPAAIIPLLATF